MLPPEKRASLEAALKSAHAMCTLADLEPSAESEAMDKRVLAGELTPGQAAAALAQAAKARAEKANKDRKR